MALNGISKKDYDVVEVGICCVIGVVLNFCCTDRYRLD